MANVLSSKFLSIILIGHPLSFVVAVEQTSLPAFSHEIARLGMREESKLITFHFFVLSFLLLSLHIVITVC
jgi:hypothetical protein